MTRAILKPIVYFLPSTANSIDMHSSNLGHQFRSPMPYLFGFQCYIPAPLLFIQTIEKLIKLTMQFLSQGVARLLTVLTLALMN